MRILLALALVFVYSAAFAVELSGTMAQGGLLFGQAEPGSSVSLDNTGVAISPDGQFVIGFGRDETGIRELEVISARTGEGFEKSMQIQKSQYYAIERVDGLPPSTVTPDPAATARIREDARMVAKRASTAISRLTMPMALPGRPKAELAVFTAANGCLTASLATRTLAWTLQHLMVPRFLRPQMVW